jgi:predicted DNA-binding transcriptional regulator AlpA
MAHSRHDLNPREPLTLVLSTEQEEALVQRVLERLQESEEDGYLNATDAAAFLGLTPAALYARVGREQVPYRRVGKRVFFKRSELREYMDDPTPRVDSGVERTKMRMEGNSPREAGTSGGLDKEAKLRVST